MRKSKLFAVLPDYVATPDGMAIDSEGNLILACPNYADQSLPGCILKIDKDKNITKWFDVPVHEDTGLASPMGIAFGPDGMILDAEGNLYIADFCANAIVKVTPDGKVSKLAENGDTDGLDQPGEPIIWNGRLVESCFDCVTGDIVINTAHEMPATLAEIEL